MSEHNHLQMHPEAIAPKVNTNLQELAHSSMGNIPGAAEFINSYFTNEDTAERLPRQQIVNQIHHLGFGNVY